MRRRVSTPRRIPPDTIDTIGPRVESERVNFRAHDPGPSGEPDPTRRSGSIPEPVRRAIDRVASWVNAELRLIASGVRTMARDVQAIVTDVKDVFSALSVRLALVETRLTAIEERDAPEGPTTPPRGCRPRPRRRRPRGPSCRGRSLDH